MNEADMNVLCILGMHRSGTSCLTGALEEAGLFLGDVSRVNPHNLKGNMENPRIVALHDDLLKENGGSWDNPPDTVIWGANHRLLRDSIISGYGGSGYWGFKDPRTLFTLDGWLEAVPRMRLAGVFRHPVPVAQSLKGRNGFSPERSFAIWTRYNERLLQCHERASFPIISFDADKEAFSRSVERAAVLLGFPAPGKNSFFDPGLKHFGGDGGDELALLPARTAEVYRRLCALALSP